jgi:hypothetical protein
MLGPKVAMTCILNLSRLLKACLQPSVTCCARSLAQAIANRLAKQAVCDSTDAQRWYSTNSNGVVALQLFFTLLMLLSQPNLLVQRSSPSPAFKPALGFSTSTM